MTAGELKKMLSGVPDDALVGIPDNFGVMETLRGAKYNAPGTYWREKQGWVELDVPLSLCDESDN